MNSLSKATRIGLVLTLGLMLTGCESALNEKPIPEGTDSTMNQYEKSLVDDAGVSHAEAEELSMAQHYRLAEERYEKFNNFYAEVQAEIFDGPWIDRSTSREIYPVHGNSVSYSPEGADEENSYFFKTFRWLPTDSDKTREFVDEVAAEWENKGWRIETQEAFGEVRHVTLLADGTWLAIDEDPARKQVLFQGYSPIFWGPVDDLGNGIVLRDKAEIEAGTESWVVRDSGGNVEAVSRQPGEYRPFPDWESMDQAEIDEMSLLDILEELEEPYD